MRKTTGRSTQSVIGTSMVEPDVERIMRWPHTNLSTDGALAGPHPRGFGAFPRFLGRYVRERKVLSWPQAVRKLSGLAADAFGLTDHGYLLLGKRANVVLFDPEQVQDQATFQDPMQFPVGLPHVIVGGRLVVRDGALTDERPGRVVRGQRKSRSHRA